MTSRFIIKICITLPFSAITPATPRGAPQSWTSMPRSCWCIVLFADVKWGYWVSRAHHAPQRTATPLCSLHGLRFHFTITPLTVDGWISRGEDISQSDLLQRWHPITAPCSNSASSLERHNLPQMLVKADYLAGGCIGRLRGATLYFCPSTI